MGHVENEKIKNAKLKNRQQTTNGKRQTANGKRQTANGKRQTGACNGLGWR